MQVPGPDGGGGGRVLRLQRGRRQRLVVHADQTRQQVRHGQQRHQRQGRLLFPQGQSAPDKLLRNMTK